MSQGLVNIATTAVRATASLIAQQQRDVVGAAHQPTKVQMLLEKINALIARSMTEHIQKAFPYHDIVLPGHDLPMSAPECWHLQSLCGANNYAYGGYDYCVAITISHHEKPTHSVIYTPSHDRLMIAVKGEGAMINDQRLRLPSLSPPLANSIIGLEIPQDEHGKLHYLTLLGQISVSAEHIRQIGSSTLTLAQVAKGNYHLFCQHEQQDWRFHPGLLLAQEAGAIAATIDNTPITADTSLIACGHPRLVSQVTPLLKACNTHQSA